MKKRLLILLVGLCYPCLAFPTEPIWKDLAQTKTAVLDIVSDVADEKINTQALTALLESAFIDEKAFVVVERSLIQRIMDEKKLQLTGITEVSGKEIGALAGADKIVVGTISKIAGKYILILKGIDIKKGICEISDVITLAGIADFYREMPTVAKRFILKARGDVVEAWKEPAATLSKLNASQTASYSEYYDKGIKYYQEKKYQLAIDFFTKAILLDNSDTQLLHYRSYSYLQLKKYDLCIADCTQLIKAIPDFRKAYINRGYAYYLKGKYPAAIENFNTAIDIDSTVASGYINRGLCYGRQKNFTMALSDLNTAVSREPNNANAYLTRGLVYIWMAENNSSTKKESLAAAISSSTHALGLDPELAMGYNNRGYAFYLSGDYKNALSDYSKAIELNPELRLAYENRSILYRKTGKANLAVKDEAKARTLKY